MLRTPTTVEPGRRRAPRRAPPETAIVLRFGPRHRGGIVHRAGSNERLSLDAAVALGLVDPEGYLTPCGYRYWRSRPVLRAV